MVGVGKYYRKSSILGNMPYKIQLQINMTDRKKKLYTLHSKNMKDYINIGVNGFGACRSW
jgi:hypothetical protein